MLLCRRIFGLDPLDKPPKLYFVIVRQPPGVRFRCLVVDAVETNGAQEVAVFIQNESAISDHCLSPDWQATSSTCLRARLMVHRVSCGLPRMEHVVVGGNSRRRADDSRRGFALIPAGRTATPIGSGVCDAEKLPMHWMEHAWRSVRARLLVVVTDVG